MFSTYAKTKRGKNIAWGQPLIEKRLKAVCEGSAAAEYGNLMDETSPIIQHDTFGNSGDYAKVDLYDLSLNIALLTYLQSTYLHVSTLMRSDDLTKDQGIYKVMADRRDKDCSGKSS